MKKIIITYGLISGAIVSAMLIITQLFQREGIVNFDNGMFIGYATMVIALSLVFFGIKSYRDNQQNGSITFWQGFKVGILISLIAAVMYAFAWEIFYNTSAGDFTQQYTNHYIEKMKTEGATQAEIDQMLVEFEKWNAMYENPFIRFGITLTEILPVGLIITLISAALLRKRELLPA